MNQNPKIDRALFSLSDKRGALEFATFLTSKFGVQILSTGGTAKMLREGGVPVTDVSEYTGFPELMDGRVKTLHPKIHGGLLYLRGNVVHEAQAVAHGIKPIDLVVVNLYPFEQTIAKPDFTDAEAIENIDIGGPGMLRSAAKNHKSVTVVCDPGDYGLVQIQMNDNDGSTTYGFRRGLAGRVFAHTAHYDLAITRYMRPHFDGTLDM